MTDTDLSTELVDAANASYGVHPGARAAHAKGVLCAATFTPDPAATRLTTAAHLAGGPLRAHVRFSNGSGDPTAPDGARDGRGIGVKLYGPDGTTDLVGLSLPCFFVRTPEDFLAFGAARRPDPATGAPDPAAVGAFLAEHPETVAAATAAVTQPVPSSYAAVTFHGIHSFGYTGPDGTVRWGRTRIVPVATDEPLTDEEAATRPPDFLATELAARLATGPARFRVEVVLAGPDDAVDDPTVAWPDDREVVPLGVLEVTGLADDRERDGDVLVFDPTRVVPGIVCSDDRILAARAGAYAVSVARRTAS
jgi:catalase